MSATTITFDEMERKSQETKGWALAAKNSRHRIVSGVLLGFVASMLKSLVAALTPEKLEQLPEENSTKLTRDLQELHCLLASFCSSPNLRYLRRRPVTSGFLDTIAESTEDLGDIVDDLVLAANEDFRGLLTECVESIPAAASAGV